MPNILIIKSYYIYVFSPQNLSSTTSYQITATVYGLPCLPTSKYTLELEVVPPHPNLHVLEINTTGSQASDQPYPLQKAEECPSHGLNFKKPINVSTQEEWVTP